jgi:sugar phosphate isomerase/epimerase
VAAVGHSVAWSDVTTTPDPSGPTGPVRVPEIPVVLSSASVFPEPTAAAFSLAADLGYDGVEVMVMAENASRSTDTLRQYVDDHQVPVRSVHSPCLLITARVWSTDPLVKLARSIELAEDVGAGTVVVHPPFVWQRAAASTFVESVAELQSRTDVRIAVENMFPVKVAGALVNSYRPHWDPVSAGYGWYTLDLSHTAASASDALLMADRMGEHLGHLHLADGSGAAKDEHLVPGRGTQPCGPVLERLVGTGFTGAVAVEVNTRGRNQATREEDLAEALTFARLHLVAPRTQPAQ